MEQHASRAESAAATRPPHSPSPRPTPPIFLEAIACLLRKGDLDDRLMRSVIREMLQGVWEDTETAALLIALRMKGETAQEIAAAASVLREHMLRLETGRPDVLDTCGTGGIGRGTLNISTAAAIVVAGAGVPVVKHGNRAFSSRSGSADVLAALGIVARQNPQWARHCLDSTGLAFCFAPYHHPLLRHVAAVRRRLQVRTLFNSLGPLVNPAGATYQLLGVGHPEMLERLAGALALLGTRRAFLVCGSDGLDEVTLSGTTSVREVQGSRVRAWEWTPRDFDLEPCALDEFSAQGPAESAAMIQAILHGHEGPATRVVLANAAAALLAAERVETLAQGVLRAREAVTSGRARQVLERLVTCSVDADPPNWETK
jgi:anthranilate phosphoribosyltransferase